MRSAAYPTRFGQSMRKLACYLRGFIAYGLPRFCFLGDSLASLKGFTESERREISERVAYYNRLPMLPVPTKGIRIADFRFPFRRKKKLATYFFDLYMTLKHFKPDLRFCYLFGDVTYEPSQPTFVKSRPIPESGMPSMSVLMKLNSARHYLFVDDQLSFRQKKDRIVCRNIVRQPHRIRFIEMYIHHPMCDVGQTNRDVEEGHEYRIKEYLSIRQQLEYKFVCCIEGNDVATNLKWVMSSNSVAVMPRPTYETWFMEGTLIPDYHYIEIKADYTDLIERLQYYVQHPEEAERIISHAHDYVQQFRNPKKEKVISLSVARQYFVRTQQITALSHD